MTAHNDLDRQLNDFLRDGPTELPYQSFDAVRDRTEQTGQRVIIGPWRLPEMNKIVTIGLGAAAVVVVGLLLGSQLFGNNVGGSGGEPTPTPEATATPAPSVAEPTSTPEAGLPEGPFVVTGTDDPVQITVNIASSGWEPYSEVDAVTKDDDGLDAPETVGVALIAWAWPAGTGFSVYGDPCQWLTTIPETPATTPDEIAAAFDSQAMTDATAPVDVTVGGFAGKAVTLRVPMSYEVPGATREEEFRDCDEDTFAFYGLDGDDTEVMRNAQGPGQIDELWILDVNGSIVILDAAYSPATPDELVDELRTLAESATFETP